MAAIEELIKSVADPRLRDALATEVARLKSAKRFGLVFEEHLPEILRLPALPIRPGTRVLKKADVASVPYRVIEEVNGKRVKIIPDGATNDGVIYGLPESVVAMAESVERSSLVVTKAFGEPMYPALVPLDSVERARGKPSHVLINADNYHALQLLLYGYEGRVDVIYIDQPYNTGARDWKYNNNYVDDNDHFRHSKWLSMMQKRLRLAKRLLRPDGVLIVAIDENEVAHLSCLLATIFPEFLRHMVSVVVNPKGTGKLNFARVDEYLFFCVPNTGNSLIRGVPAALKNASQPGEGALFFSPLAASPLLPGNDDGDDASADDDDANDTETVDGEDLLEAAAGPSDYPFPVD